MRLGTCVALELVVGISLLTGLGVSANWGIGEVRAHLQREARAAVARQSIMDDQLPATGPASPRLSTATTGMSTSLVPGEIPRPEPAASEQPPAGKAGDADESAEVAELGDERGAQPGQGIIEDEELDDDEAAVAPVAPNGPIAPDGPVVEASYYGVFSGVRDDLLLAPLREAAVKRVKFNRGGSTISLRIDFTNGARAAFKPEQAAPHSIPRKEIAAYRIDRLLGLGAVPPAIGRALSASELFAALMPGSQVFLPRLKAEMRVRNDRVAGELSWWIPVIERAKIDGYEIDTTDGIVTWKRYLTVGKEIPDANVGLVKQISSMVLFDFLINNPDRWSGSNARVSADGRQLYFMDNTMSFGLDGDGHRKCRIYLERSQKFSRSVVAAVRALTADKVRAALAEDHEPFQRLLSDAEIDKLIERRDYALAYIDGLIAQHGEGAVLVFP